MDDATKIRNLVILASSVHLLAISIFFAFPILDLLYPGDSFIWYILLVYIIANYIYPIIALSTVVEHKSPVRMDLYSVTTTAMIVINCVFFATCGVLYFLYTNTSFSGASPLNDERAWCCHYYLDHPEFCSNTISCLPNPEMSSNATLWILSAVLVIVTFVHVFFTRLLRISGAVASPSEKNSSEGKLLLIAVSLVYVGIFTYWCAFPLLDTLYMYEYPTLGIPPGPGKFISTLYTWQWFFIWILICNYLPPVISMFTLMMEKSHLLTAFHFWSILLIGILSGICFLTFLGILVGDCNWFYSGESICKSYRWCCSHFAVAYELCGNVTPCDGDLLPNAEFVAHIVCSGVFSMFAFIMIWLNYRMIKYEVFA